MSKSERIGTYGDISLRGKVVFDDDVGVWKEASMAIGHGNEEFRCLFKELLVRDFSLNDVRNLTTQIKLEQDKDDSDARQGSEHSDGEGISIHCICMVRHS